jgi:LPXTG-motif cell wall-anchored protein
MKPRLLLGLAVVAIAIAAALWASASPDGLERVMATLGIGSHEQTAPLADYDLPAAGSAGPVLAGLLGVLAVAALAGLASLLLRRKA